jgi:putative drug exporter of the RND superfamily
MASLTRWVLAHKRLVVTLWLFLALAGMAAAGPASKALSQDYSVPGREGWQTNQAISKTFHTGGNSAPLLAVVTLPPGAGADSSPVRRDLLALQSRIERTLPDSRVASYASTHDRAFVSRDGRTTFVLAYPKPDAHSFGQSPKAAKRLRAALSGAAVAGAPVHLTGLDALQNATGDSSGPGVFAEALLGGLGALLVLIFVFASLQALVPVMIAVVSIMTCFLAVWALTAVTEVSALVEFVIALVGLGVAIDYSLLVVVRWREERAHGHEGDEAIVRAMETAGRAVVFSGTTVAIGLFALVALPLPFLRSVGFGGMLIPLVSVLSSITLLPIILAGWGPKLDWPHRRTDSRASRAWTRLAEVVVRRRWPAATVATAVLLALVVAATSLQFGASAGNPDTLARHGDAKTGLTALERSGIGVGALTPIELLAPRQSAPQLAARLSALQGVHGAAAPQGKAWNGPGLAVVDVLPTATDSSSSGREALKRVRAAAHAFAGGQGQPKVGGIIAQNQDFVSAVYGSFPLMVALIALIAFVLLARAFRSLLLPLKAVVLNVLSVAAAWGAVTLVWQKGFGSHAIWGIDASGSIPSWMPIMIFAFLFGLSMDYEVFILSRMREAFDETGSTSAAVVNGIGRTGRLVTSAALILFLTFVAMASGPQVELKMLATGLAAGILFDATVIRAVLVPALVSLFGRWNWWLPPGPARLLRVEPSEPRVQPAD